MKYLITIAKSRVKDYVSTETIRQVIYALEGYGISCVYGKLERHSKYYQLHFHGIFEVPRGLQYSNLVSLCGMHLNFRRIKKQNQISRTKDYIDKHYHPSLHTELDTELANYFAHHYLF